MNEYEIISERCGEPGAVFIPAEGINIDALLEHGFIKAKTKTKTAQKETTENVD
jgi:hypothetical protein